MPGGSDQARYRARFGNMVENQYRVFQGVAQYHDQAGRASRRQGLGGRQGEAAIFLPGARYRRLKPDPEKLQTFRTRSCVRTNAWSEIAIQSEAISLQAGGDGLLRGA